MKKLRFIFLLSFLSLVVFNSCEDKLFETFKANVPIYLSFDEIRSSVKNEPANAITSPGKIYFKDNYIFINEYLKGIHVIDNSDPSSPQNISFIAIPGNIDMSVKNNILYADSYVDLVAIDISDINNISVVDREKEIFPYTLPPYDYTYRVAKIDYTKGIVIGWKIETVTEEVSNQYWPYPIFLDGVEINSVYSGLSSVGGGQMVYGIGGSMARFVADDNNLFCVDESTLNIVDISDESVLKKTSERSIGWQIETIFKKDDNLFIGSQTGMIIVDVSNPNNPCVVSNYWHVTSCDPVVVKDNYAWVSLRQGTDCGGGTNTLDVVDISNLSEPEAVKSYPMTNPYGLAIADTTLFLCDGSAGLKVFNINNPLDISLISTFSDIHAYDVIAYNDILMLIGDDGLYQYDYSDIENIVLLSKIGVEGEE